MQILPPYLHNIRAVDTLDALRIWSSTTPLSLPCSPSDSHQSAWDKPQAMAISALSYRGPQIQSQKPDYLVSLQKGLVLGLMHPLSHILGSE